MNRFVYIYLAIAAIALPTAAKPQPVATIAFRLIDNRIFIPVTLNGRGPFQMMFDTGGMNLLHTSYAKRLGLQIEAGPVVPGTGGMKVKTGRTTLRDLRIGPIVLKDQRAIVMPEHDGGNVFGTFDFAGLVGRELMDAYVIRIDYRRRELTFFDRSYNYDGAGEVLACDPAFNIPVVDARIDGEPARVGLDTGARTSIVLYAGFIAEHEVRERYKPRYSGITGWGIGGPIRTDLARIGSVALGRFEVPRPVARFTLMKTGLTAGNAFAAIVGPGILERFMIYLDLPRNRVILEPLSDLSKPDAYDRSGMWIGQKDADTFVVLDVMSGTPAATAGFAAGDEIIAVDETTTKRLLLPEVRERFRTEPDGTAILMKTRHGGKTIDRSLILRDFLSM